MDKKELLKIFQKKPEKYWKVELFEREGFKRKVCPICGKGFWSIEEREHCPDPECGEDYEFIEGNIGRKVSYIEIWKKMEEFFVKNGHTSIPKYPVLARWREDIYYNIASIVNFQRFDNGVMIFEYPANPLIVPQVCLRFNDILNVGVTGRHFTAFVMVGQHAFNWPQEGYWKDRTIELNFKFLTEEMKIPKEKLVYVEDLWAMPDFSALGPYIETFSLGLELSNSGFMYFTLKKGEELEELPIKVVDVGWGLERLAWFSQGTLTAYDAVFGDIIDRFLKESGLEFDRKIFKIYSKISGKLNIEDISDYKKAKHEILKKMNIDEKTFFEKIEKFQGMYALLDHARALAFAISDGGLPSNTGAGYFLRVILRRSLDLIEKYFPNINLTEVVIWHVDYLKPLFPELKKSEKEIITVIEAERKRYEESKKKNQKIIEFYKNREINNEELVKIYETYGISPEQIGKESTKEFYDLLHKKHALKKINIGETKKYEIETIPLYYENVFEFEAKVLKIEDGCKVILDRTAFFPRQGGQDCDSGYINEYKVVDVIKIGKTIIHVLESNDFSFKEGDIVKCIVDRERRMRISKNHVAVHIINASARKIIGNWVWQEGSEVKEDKARLDITHFESLNEEIVEKIENYANEIVEKNLPIKIEILPRIEAEKRYGFRIYQGGAIPEKNIRIVSIGDEDIEACSGTHNMLKSTKEVGYITITKTKRISDGVVRIEFCSDNTAYQYLKNKEKILEECCKILNVEEEQLVKAIEDLFKKWKKARKKFKIYG
ncbi:MAG: alanine--tRNA ligase-related protein [Candidatus Aenigmatarchaeota archaeon]